MPDWIPSAITWLISTGIGAAVAYATIKAKLENHDARIAAIERELGSRETGIRGALHKLPNTFLEIDRRITRLEVNKKPYV